MSQVVMCCISWDTNFVLWAFFFSVQVQFVLVVIESYIFIYVLNDFWWLHFLLIDSLQAQFMHKSHCFLLIGLFTFQLHFLSFFHLWNENVSWFLVTVLVADCLSCWQVLYSLMAVTVSILPFSFLCTCSALSVCDITVHFSLCTE